MFRLRGEVSVTRRGPRQADWPPASGNPEAQATATDPRVRAPRNSKVAWGLFRCWGRGVKRIVVAVQRDAANALFWRCGRRWLLLGCGRHDGETLLAVPRL